MSLTRDLARLHSDSDGNLILANNLTVDTNTLIVDAATNRVGMGTNTPSVALDVVGDLKLTNSADAVLSISDEIGEVGDGNLAFQSQNTAGSALKPMGFRAENIRFATGSAERMRVSDNGLGIGTAAPNDKVVAIVGNGGGILQATYDTGTATSGQQLGGVGFKGYASGNSIAAADAKVVGYADGAHSGSSAPGRLEMWTKPATVGPGSAASKRYTITSHGDHVHEINERGWTVNAYSLTGGTYEYQCRKRYSTGSSAGTYDVLRFKRHYWGSGSVRFDVRQTYYVTTEDNTFWLQGHGRNDASYNPSWSLGHTGNQNSSSGRLSLDTTGGSSSPGNSVANYVDVQIYVPAYTQYYVTATVAHSTYYSDPSSMSDANSFALH